MQFQRLMQLPVTTPPDKMQFQRQMQFAVTTPPVKMRLERPAGRDKRQSKNNYSSEYAQSKAEGILNRLFPHRAWARVSGLMPFASGIAAGYVLFCTHKREPEKRPLLSKRGRPESRAARP